jgi:hypothetical protein
MLGIANLCQSMPATPPPPFVILDFRFLIQNQRRRDISNGIQGYSNLFKAFSENIFSEMAAKSLRELR